MNRSDGVTVCRKFLQTFSCFHVPDAHALIEGAADDQVRLWVEVDAEDKVGVTAESLKLLALQTEKKRNETMRIEISERKEMHDKRGGNRQKQGEIKRNGAKSAPSQAPRSLWSYHPRPSKCSESLRTS